MLLSFQMRTSATCKTWTIQICFKQVKAVIDLCMPMKFESMRHALAYTVIIHIQGSLAYMEGQELIERQLLLSHFTSKI